MDFLVANGVALLFYFFAAVVLISAILVVTLRNPMYSAISLLASFLSVAALFLIRHAEFVGIVQVFVYGGGIMVLFLFVIMLVNLHRLHEVHLFGAHAPLALLVALLLAAIFGVIFWQTDLGTASVDASAFTTVEGTIAGNTEAVAWELYRLYLLPFEIASLFLLVAMIGAVVLGRKD